MLVDVELVFDKLVLNHLLEIGSLAAQMRQAVDDILHEMKAVQIVLHPHIEGGGDRALLLIAAHVEVTVGPAIRQPMNQPRVSMEAEDDVPVLREERIIILVTQAVRMLAC